MLTWNANAVNAVRASAPAKFQVEGLIYMSYVQAAVYDAVTKLEGRYVPYHDFTVTVAPGTSVQAAVAAAAQTTLDNYLPDQAAAVDGEYNAYIASLGGLGATGVSDGVALGQAAANDIIALRSGDGRNAPTPAYGTIGPILPGQWQLQSAAQTAQTPWVATMRPFVLQAASQFRVGPPPALTSQQYAKDLNETVAFGAANSTVRTPEETATAYFWNANTINQYNATMQNAVTGNGMDLVDAAHLFAMGELTTADAGMAVLGLEVLLSRVAARSPRSGTPTSTVTRPRRPIPAGRLCWRRRPTPSIRPRTAASRPRSRTHSPPRSTRTTSTSPSPVPPTAVRR